jgi:hypothetical protein
MFRHLIQRNMHRHIRRQQIRALPNSSIRNRRQQRKHPRRNHPQQKHNPAKLKNKPADTRATLPDEFIKSKCNRHGENRSQRSF